jgi:hypothetical protein
MQVIISLLMILIFTSCAQTGSSDILTNSIYLSQTIVVDKDQNVTCTAVFQVGSAMGTYLELTNGDTVECNGTVMEKTELLGIVRYSANVAYVANGTYEILFERASDESYSSTVVLPNAITVTAPTDNYEYSKGSALPLAWTLSTGTKMNMTVSYTHSGSQSASITNTQTTEVGSYNFDALTSQITEDGNVYGVVKFTRIKTGTQATDLSGVIEAKLEKEIDIVFVD